MTVLAVRGQFHRKSSNYAFVVKLRCVTCKNTPKNKTAPKSAECEFEVRFTVIGELNKDPSDMFDDFKKIALYLVVMESTGQHDWDGIMSVDGASCDDLKFGVHGPILHSQFGIHFESDFEEDQSKNENVVQQEKTLDDTKIFLDKDFVWQEMIRIA